MIDRLFDHTVRWLAPMLCFTAEEAWLARHPGETNSVHLETFARIPPEWRDDALAEKWRKVRSVRRVVTGALELERAQKRHRLLARSASGRLRCRRRSVRRVADIDFAEVCITSAATLVAGEAAGATRSGCRTLRASPWCRRAEGTKCARSWKLFDPASAPIRPIPDITPRDAQAMREWDAMQKAAE